MSHLSDGCVISRGCMAASRNPT